jgi:small nuclear ribonucleoprotein (snRNP)-like protein
MISDPTDLLKTYLKEEVMVKLKDGTTFVGILEGFDEHHNTILSASQTLKFIRGENIVFFGQQ